MGDLAADTHLEPVSTNGDASSRFRAKLSRDWEIWGPNGGYLVALMLRAAGQHVSLPRPATVSTHFLGVAELTEVDVEVVALRSGRTATSARVSLSQGGRPIAETMVWATSNDINGLAHDRAPLPDVPPPQQLPDTDPGPFRFWTNFDRRPVPPLSHEQWLARDAGPPVSSGWYRYVPTPSFDDPWIDAGRLAILLDTLHWPAAANAYRDEDLRAVYAPSLDVNIQFHRMPRGAEWLFVEASASIAADGLVGSTARAWAGDGRLLGTSGQQMLCRPVPVSEPRTTPTARGE